MTRTPRRFALLVSGTLVLSGGLVLTATPAYAADHPVTDLLGLSTAISNAGDGDTITFQNAIVADADLPDIDDDITIDGAGFTFDGDAGAWNGFSIIGGAVVTITNLEIIDTNSAAVSATSADLTLHGVTTDSGLEAVGSDVTITGSEFSGERAFVVGTGVDVLVETTTFDSAFTDGLVVDVDSGTVTLTDVTASGSASYGLDIVAGASVFTATRLTLTANDTGMSAAFHSGTTATITGSTASLNLTDGYDLSAYDDSEISITDSRAAENGSDGFSFWSEDSAIAATRISANANWDDGIQISAYDAAVIEVVDSTSDANGYGIYFGDLSGTTQYPVANFRSSTISNSTEDGVLGEIGSGVSVLFANTTISGNGVNDEEGFDVYGAGTLTIAHSTVAANASDQGPGTRSNRFESGMTVAIHDSIIAGNHGELDLEIDSDVTLAVTHSLIGVAGLNATPATTSGAGNLVAVDPQLGALANNGGPTLTHLLAATSPAVNAGDPAIVGAPAFDQRGNGFARIVLGRIDMGAVERSPELVPTGSDIAPLALGALALLLVGGIAISLRRRTA